MVDIKASPIESPAKRSQEKSMNDLIQQLRDGADAPHLSIGQAWNLLGEAADALAAQSAAMEGLQSALDARIEDHEKLIRDYAKRGEWIKGQNEQIERMDEILERLTRERDHATVIVGELAALIPLDATIAATRTGTTMIRWFKDQFAERDRLHAGHMSDAERLAREALKGEKHE
jgi:hypothetical protein